MSTYEEILARTVPYEKGRGFVFTINNFTQEDKDRVENLINSPRVQYGIAETEHCEEGQGTPHIQGYVFFQNTTTRQHVSNLLEKRAHIEKAKGNPRQNYNYCSKEGTVFVKRQMKQTEGQGGGFLEMYNDMKTLSPEEFESKYPQFWVMNREKVMRVMIDSAMPKVKDFGGDLHDKNIWLWGAPGLGKSRWAALQGSYGEIFKKNFNKWWDGYSLLSTKIVIIEDYPCVPAGNTLVQHIKIWGDRYPFEAECKGSHLLVEPGRFFLIITSNYPIERCFENSEDIRAIKRRFKEVEIKQGDFYNQGMNRLDRAIIQ